jgi:hypothetical protein
VFRHPVKMCVRRTGSSQSRCLIRRGDAAGGNPVSSLFWPGPVVL